MSLRMLEKRNSPRPSPLLMEPTFEKQVRESQTAWKYFCVYRDQERRSYALVGQAVHRSKTRVTAIAKKWQWQKRVRDFDLYQDEQSRLELAEARREANRESLKLINKTKQLVADRLNKIDPSSFSPRDLLYAVRILIQAEQLLLGGVTSRVEVSTPETERERIVGLARTSFIQGVHRFPGIPPERLRMMIADSFGLTPADLIEESSADFSRLGVTG